MAAVAVSVSPLCGGDALVSNTVVASLLKVH